MCAGGGDQSSSGGDVVEKGRMRACWKVEGGNVGEKPCMCCLVVRGAKWVYVVKTGFIKKPCL